MFTITCMFCLLAVLLNQCATIYCVLLLSGRFVFCPFTVVYFQIIFKEKLLKLDTCNIVNDLLQCITSCTNFIIIMQFCIMLICS